MNEPELSKAMAYLNDDLITDAMKYEQKKIKRPTWATRAAIAACLGAVVVGGALFNFSRKNDQGNKLQHWDNSFRDMQYFSYCAQEDGALYHNSLFETPYSDSISFDDARHALEGSDVIPIMDTHPIFKATADYYDDGSLYALVLSWHRRDAEGLENYSDLTVMAGYREIPKINDCIAVEIDENFNIIKPSVTVTERDGINIIAEGGEHFEKVITFQNEYGWYQISGSWNDSYEDVVSLLDWFWEHPIDFSRFMPDAE